MYIAMVIGLPLYAARNKADRWWINTRVTLALFPFFCGTRGLADLRLFSFCSIMETQIAFQAMTTAPRPFTLEELFDVNGQSVNVKTLATNHVLIIITMKNAECPLCIQLLKFLNLYGLDPNMTEYFEPLEGRIWVNQPEKKKLFKLLLTKDAYFIVICPGSEERVAEVQQEVPFMHHPFIGGKQAMQIGRELKLCISDEELWPAIVAIAPHRFNASIIKLGRSFGDMAHQTLIKYLFDKRIPVERKGVAFMEEARRTIEKLRLKATKCHQGRLVTTLSLRPCSPPAVPAQSQLAQTQKWTSLPPEILQNILSFIPETRYIAKAARTSRQFYMAYCNVLMKRLREQSTQVRHALPSDTEQLKVVGGGYQDADRWWYSPNGIGLRDLERRVDGLERLLRETPGDIRPFFRRTLGWTFEIPPPQEQGLSRFQ